MIEEIDDRIGPKSLVIIAVVSSDLIMEFYEHERLKAYRDGWC